MSPPSEVLEGARDGVSSLPNLKYPLHRNVPDKNSFLWLKDKRQDDGAEGLWRVHDKLYDFSDFIDRHPGGSEWLELTKGTDITEAFESHHISPMPARLLEKYEIRPAVTVRNSPYTFHRDGFYATLKRRVYEVLPESRDRGPSLKSKLMLDSLVLAVFVTAVQAAVQQSSIVAWCSGILLGMSTTAAHNFFHQRDNLRRYYFNLSLMTAKAWRVSHALSHHQYPNTVSDLEIVFGEPYLCWLPTQDKTITKRYISWLYTPFIYSLIFINEFIIRTVYNRGLQFMDLIPFTLPAVMVMYAPSGSVLNTLFLWIQIALFGGLYLGIVGFNAAHHHPQIFHDGDTPRKDLDFGLAQLDTVRDRPSISGVEGTWIRGEDGTIKVTIDNSRSFSAWTLFKVLTNFGHHTLHHLFPTIDHAHLPHLYPVLAQTLGEFHIPFHTMSIPELVLGQFRQLANNEPNTVAPSYMGD